MSEKQERKITIEKELAKHIEGEVARHACRRSDSGSHRRMVQENSGLKENEAGVNPATTVRFRSVGTCARLIKCTTSV